MSESEKNFEVTVIGKKVTILGQEGGEDGGSLLHRAPASS